MSDGIICKMIRAYWSKRRVVTNQFFFRTNYYSIENFTWCHRKQSLLILFTTQSYKVYLSMLYGEPTRLYERTPIRRSKLMNNLAFINQCRDSNLIPHSPEDDQHILIEMSSCILQFFSELVTTLWKNSHGVTANSVYLSSPTSHQVSLKIIIL